MVLATIHIPLADVPRRPDAGVARDDDWADRRGAAAVRLSGAADRRRGLESACRRARSVRPEEELALSPAIAACRSRGIDVAGPYPADTLFVRAHRGEFDAVVACYHDQGLIPVKLLAFGQAVNVTLGLPIVRTSVDHGTAFDIAGRGVADPESMIAAVLLAARLAGRSGDRARLRFSARSVMVGLRVGTLLVGDDHHRHLKPTPLILGRVGS